MNNEAQLQLITLSPQTALNMMQYFWFHTYLSHTYNAQHFCAHCSSPHILCSLVYYLKSIKQLFVLLLTLHTVDFLFIYLQCVLYVFRSALINVLRSQYLLYRFSKLTPTYLHTYIYLYMYLQKQNVKHPLCDDEVNI